MSDPAEGTPRDGIRPMRILIIDDDPSMVTWLRRVVSARGFDPIVAANASQGLERLIGDGAEMVICDVWMPDVDGLELLRTVRQDRRLADTPMILTSGSDDPVLAAKALDCGADDFIRKPMEVRELFARIRAQFRRVLERNDLRELALVDELTGVFNRRGLTISLERELSRAKRTGSRLSVLVADVDDFKTVNDERGHAGGDALLCAIGSAFCERVRPTDIVGRLGGDEFVVILPDTSAEQANQIAERLMMPLAAPHADAGLRCSIGIASIEGRDHSVAEILATADREMYRQKRATRPSSQS